jgi:hypothetical protein
MRFVHVYSGGGPVDIYVDNEQIVSQLAFGTATEFATVPSGDRQIQVVAAGEDPGSALIDKTITADSGEFYNVLIGGQDDDLDAREYTVNTDQVGEGQARIRFIPGGPDTGAVDLTLSVDAEPGTAEADDTNMPNFMMDRIGADGAGGLMDYQDVPAGVYGVYARDMDTDDSRVNVASVDLQAGMVYDIVVLGQLASDNLTFVPLMTSLAAPCSDTLGVGEAGDACARFIHTSADAGAVDIYIDDQVAVQAISYGTVTEFAAVAGGEHQIRVVAANQPVEDAWLDETMTLDEGQAYQFSILGIAEEDDNGDNDLRLLQNEIDLSPLADGQTRVRLVHAVSDGGSVDISGSGPLGSFTDVNFGDVTDYLTIEAGAYDLLVTGDDNATVLDVTGQQLDSGTVYDLFVIGLAADQSVELLVVPTAVTPLEAAQGTPIAVEPGTADDGGQVTPVTAGEATAVTGEQADASPVGAAPVTPVVTPEGTPTPES